MKYSLNIPNSEKIVEYRDYSPMAMDFIQDYPEESMVKSNFDETLVNLLVSAY